MTASALALSHLEFRNSLFHLHASRVARGAKLDLMVTLADPAKRGGAFSGSQGLHF